MGQLSTDQKSNEISAILKLLDMFCAKGKSITIDAIGRLGKREVSQAVFT